MDKKTTDITKLLLANVTDKNDIKVLKALLPDVINYIVGMIPTVDLSTQDYSFPRIFVMVYLETKETDYAKVYRSFFHWYKNELPKVVAEFNMSQDYELYNKRFVEDYKNKLSLMKL